MPTQEEILLAKMAIEKKYLSESHIASIFMELKKIETQGQNVSMAQYLLTQNFLNKTQLSELQKNLQQRNMAIQEAAQGVGLAANKMFAHYRIEKELGRGGMGIVYKAHDTKVNRPVALKILLTGSVASEAEIRRFQRESEAAGGLNHPNIVAVYDVGECSGYHYFTMEFVEGETLDSLIKKKTNRKKLLQILEKVARALANAHEHKIIHRDIKPANILVSAEGEPKITDFGLAKKLGSTSALTRSDAILGTPFYIAPEMVTKKEKPDWRVDIYALGVILYETLTGHPPFSASTLVELHAKIANTDPILPSKWNVKVDRDIETICLKCLEKDREHRYQSGNDLADDISRYLEKKPILVKRSNICLQWFKKLKRVKSQTNLVLGVVAGIAVAIAGMLWYENGKLPRSGHSDSLQQHQSSDGKQTRGPRSGLDSPNTKEPTPKEDARVDWKAVFSNPIRSSPEVKVATHAAEYNQYYSASTGENWRFLANGISQATFQFPVKAVPRQKVYLFIEHLSSFVPNKPQGGISPVDILVNNRIVRSGFDPGRPVREDWFEIKDYLMPGENVITLRYCPHATTHYWVYRVELTNRIVWFDDFENYRPGPLPSSWEQDKARNSVETNRHYSGRQSLQVAGMVRCPPEAKQSWELVSQVCLDNPTGPTEGSISLVCGKAPTENRRHLVTFGSDMVIRSSRGSPLAEYTKGNWYRVKVGYRFPPDASQATLSYSISGSVIKGETQLVRETTTAFPFEGKLDRIALIASQGSMWVDEMRMLAGSDR